MVVLWRCRVCGAFEAHAVRQEDWAERGGAAASVFEDQEFSGAAVGARGVVELVWVEGGDEVGVGFDCTGFAKVGEGGSFVGEGFDGAAGLAERDDREQDVEFAGEQFESAGVLGDFELVGSRLCRCRR